MTLTIYHLIYIFSFYVVISKIVESRRLNAQLQRIPIVGASGFFSSYLAALRYFRHARQIVQEGYQKYPGHAFRVPLLSKWQIVVSGPKMIDDLQRAPDDVLSPIAAVVELLQLNYTMGWQLHFSDYHVDVVRNTLTRNIAARFPDVRDEIVAAFADEVPAKHDGWTKVLALQTAMKIVSRTSNRLFIGLPLCRDPAYRHLSINMAMNVVKAAQIIHRFPDFLKPFVARYFTNAPAQMQQGIKLLGPLIQSRLDEEEEYGRDRPGRPNDLISWLLDEAPANQKIVSDLTLQILMINFSALHTTSMSFTVALYCLAARPDLADILRQEIKTTVEEDGWTKASMVKMHKLDSFLKESLRLYGTGAILMDRKCLKDFTFSDGTAVPAGCSVAVATNAIHFDPANYQDAHEFQAFRFSNMRMSENEAIKHQMVTTKPEWLGFGHGRHACPGRFFAVNEIKAMMAHVIMTYDVKFEDERSSIPDPKWFTSIIYPDPTVEVFFRAREAVVD